MNPFDQILDQLKVVKIASLRYNFIYHEFRMGRCTLEELEKETDSVYQWSENMLNKVKAMNYSYLDLLTPEEQFMKEQEGMAVCYN